MILTFNNKKILISWFYPCRYINIPSHRDIISKYLCTGVACNCLFERAAMDKSHHGMLCAPISDNQLVLFKRYKENNPKTN